MSIKTSTLALMALFSLGGISYADVAVTPAGLKIVWKPLKKEFDGFQVYNADQGTYITLAVMVGGQGIIAFDDKASNVELTVGGKKMKAEFNSWTKISKDGKAMKLEVQSKQLPPADAANFSIKGKAHVTLASVIETLAAGPQQYNKGDKVTIKEGFDFTIDDISETKFGNDKLEITLGWTTKIPEFAAIRFYDETGKEIESRAGGSSSMSFGKKTTVKRTYLLKRKSDILKIEVDLWKDLTKAVVPIDIKLGIQGQIIK